MHENIGDELSNTGGFFFRCFHSTCKWISIQTMYEVKDHFWFWMQFIQFTMYNTGIGCLYDRGSSVFFSESQQETFRDIWYAPRFLEFQQEVPEDWIDTQLKRLQTGNTKIKSNVPSKLEICRTAAGIPGNGYVIKT